MSAKPLMLIHTQIRHMQIPYPRMNTYSNISNNTAFVNFHVAGNGEDLGKDNADDRMCQSNTSSIRIPDAHRLDSREHTGHPMDATSRKLVTQLPASYNGLARHGSDCLSAPVVTCEEPYSHEQ